MRLKTKVLCTAKSLGASFNDVVGEVFGKPFKVEMSWTGTVAGTITLEETTGGVWSKIPDSDVTVNNTSTKSINYTAENVFKNVRIVWTRTSGTGTLDASLSSEE